MFQNVSVPRCGQITNAGRAYRAWAVAGSDRR